MNAIITHLFPRSFQAIVISEIKNNTFILQTESATQS